MGQLIVDKNSLKGKILLASPNNPVDTLSQSVILITHHCSQGVRGMQINLVIDEPTLDEVGRNVGIHMMKKDRVYAGGGLDANKIHLLHSSEWMSVTSRYITDEIGLTIDISVLAAIAGGTGPDKYRACSGHWFWENDVMQDQLNPKDKQQRYHWQLMPATAKIVFDYKPEDQWQLCMEQFAKQQVAHWF